MAGYAVTAMFYDPMAADAHARVDAAIAMALEPLRHARDPLLDIGAGTGLTTALIARSVRHAEIFAIEPDPAMRSALMTRVWSDPDLRQRVTLLPTDAVSAPLPERIAGAVLSASLVHFSPDERRCLWARLASRLTPGGRIIVELQAPHAVDIPPTQMAEAQVGRMRYVGTAQAKALGGNRQEWSICYRSELDGVLLSEEHARYNCFCIESATLLAEAAEAGLVGSMVDELVVLATG